MDKSKDRKATDVYAMLHRVVENGEATDNTWQRLTSVCIELDNRDEAVDAFHKISDPGLRRGLRRQLAQRGWVSEARDEDEIKSLMVTDADLNPSTKEKLDDSLRFLFEGNMPWYTLGGTLAFPVVLGLGGLLTAASDSVVLQVLALLPALFVLGMVGAFGRHVLLLALEERDDASGMPSPGTLVREVPGILVDFMALSAVFLMPGVALILLGLPWYSAPLFGLSGFLLPMSAALRLSTRDWRALMPGPLLGAVRRTGTTYLGVAVVIALLFSPAALAFFFTVKMPVFLTISVMGPLTVAPFFLAARMMGLTFYYEQKAFEGLFQWSIRSAEPAARQQAPMRRLAVPSTTKAEKTMEDAPEEIATAEIVSTPSDESEIEEI